VVTSYSSLPSQLISPYLLPHSPNEEFMEVASLESSGSLGENENEWETVDRHKVKTDIKFSITI